MFNFKKNKEMKFLLEVFDRQQNKLGEYSTNCKSALGGAIKMAHLLTDCQIKQTTYDDVSTVYVNYTKFGVFSNEEAEHCANVLRAFDTKSIVEVKPFVKDVKYV